MAGISEQELAGLNVALENARASYDAVAGAYNDALKENASLSHDILTMRSDLSRLAKENAGLREKAAKKRSIWDRIARGQK